MDPRPRRRLAAPARSALVAGPPGCARTGEGRADAIRGIRAALCHDLFTARQSREDDDANVICLGSGVVDLPAAVALVRTFVAARFSHAERHLRRRAKVCALEAAELAGTED